jgi:putative transposase
VTCPCRFLPVEGRARPKDGQMKRARFAEEQIIKVLREHEAGAKARDLARKHVVSEATLYN